MACVQVGDNMVRARARVRERQRELLSETSALGGYGGLRLMD